jgi:hypothetical protein
MCTRWLLVFMMPFLNFSVSLASMTGKKQNDLRVTSKQVVPDGLSGILRHMLDNDLTRLQNPREKSFKDVARCMYQSMSLVDYENTLRKLNKQMLPLNPKAKSDIVNLLVARCSSFHEANYEWTFFSQANYLTEISDNEVRSQLQHKFQENDEWLRRVLYLLSKV